MSTRERRAVTSARFRRVASAVVDDLHERIAGATWVVAEGDGEALDVVAAAGAEPSPGEGEGVRPSPDTDLVVPLELPDGSRYGALCGLGAGGRRGVPVTYVSRMVEVLSNVLGAEWEAREQARRAEAEARRASQAEEDALVDPLTGACNRRAWDRALDAEDRRQRRYGGSAAVIVVDLDDLKRVNDSQGHLGGDLMLRLVADTLDATSRDSDVVARTGGDEFALLALDCEDDALGVLVGRVREALEATGVPASVGAACRKDGAGLAEAWAEADGNMYADKARRKG